MSRKMTARYLSRFVAVNWSLIWFASCARSTENLLFGSAFVPVSLPIALIALTPALFSAAFLSPAVTTSTL